MGYGTRDVIVDMKDGYTLEINWSSFPTATIKGPDGTIVGRKDYVMTGSFLIRPRITRWAARSIRQHEKMILRLSVRETE